MNAPLEIYAVRRSPQRNRDLCELHMTNFGPATATLGDDGRPTDRPTDGPPSLPPTGGGFSVTLKGPITFTGHRCRRFPRRRRLREVFLYEPTT